IEDETAIGEPVTRDTVAAAANGERHSALARERDHSRDVIRVRDADDRRGATIEPAVERGPRPVVLGVVRPDDATGHTAQPRDRFGGTHFVFPERVATCVARFSRICVQPCRSCSSLCDISMVRLSLVLPPTSSKVVVITRPSPMTCTIRDGLTISRYGPAN